jgi:hypothetical protein
MSWQGGQDMGFGVCGMNFLTGGALITALGGFAVAGWSYVKLALAKLAGLVIVKAEFTGLSAGYVLGDILTRYGPPKFRERVYGLVADYDRELTYCRYFATEELDAKSLFFCRGLRSLFVVPLRSTADKDKDPGSLSVSKGIVITGLRGMIDLEELIQRAGIQATRCYRESTQQMAAVRRFRVERIPGGTEDGHPVTSASLPWYKLPTRRLIGVNPNSVGYIPAQAGSMLNSLAFPVEIDVLEADIRRWMASKAWHHERNLPWKRGVGIHGKPGGGKTSFIRALAADCDMPIFVFSLAELNNTEFLSGWAKLKHYTPCIALFEDFDTVFDKRTNISPQSGLSVSRFPQRGSGSASVSPSGSPTSSDSQTDAKWTSSGFDLPVQFDTLLNCIDGADRSISDGILTVITTNRIERLDPALGGPDDSGRIRPRPGRIDRVIEFKEISREGKRKILNRIAAGLPRVLADFHRELDDCLDPLEMPAVYEFRVSQAALEAYMAGEVEEESDSEIASLALHAWATG